MTTSNTLLLAIALFCVSTGYAQNVGIGTTTPGTKLTVAGGIASTPVSAAAAPSVTIPSNASIFYLTAVSGSRTDALTMASPTAGQYLTIYNLDGNPATFAGYTITASTGVMTFQYINGTWQAVSDNSFIGGGNYIKNQTAQQASSNFNISGNGVIGGTATVSSLSTAGVVVNSAAGLLGTTSLVPTAYGGMGANMTAGAIGAIPYATSTTAYGSLAAVATGSYLRSAGTGTAPVWSTLSLPNAATKGDILYATGTNTIGNLADVASGSVLMSGGVGASPTWSAGAGQFIQNQVASTQTGGFNISSTGYFAAVSTNNSTAGDIQVGCTGSNCWTVDNPNGIIGFAGYGVAHGQIAFYPDYSTFALINSSCCQPSGDIGVLNTSLLLDNFWAGGAYFSGNVGIGISNPGTQLTNTASNILGGDGAGVSTSSMGWTNNGAGYTVALYNANTSATNSDGLAVKIAGTAGTNRILDLSTGASQAATGTSVMYVTGSGNVNIPILGASLPVYTDASKNLTTTAPTTGAQGYWTRSGTTLHNTNTGDNVGIGTATPAVTLDVATTATGGGVGSTVAVADFLATANTTAGYYTAIRTGTATSSTNAAEFRFAPLSTGNIAQIGLYGYSTGPAVNSAGSVGIGNTAPAYPLDVSGVINAATGYKVAGGTPSTSTYLKGNGTNFVAGTIAAADLSAAISGTAGYHAKFTGANTLGNGLIYDNGTDIGVNQASPNATLDVNGNIQISNSTIPMGLMTEVQGTTPLLDFDVNFRETNKTNTYMGAAMRIDTRGGSSALFSWLTRAAGTATELEPMVLTAAGYLGIGTTTPSVALQVVGSGMFSSELYVNNNGTGTGTGSTGCIQIGDGTVSKTYGTGFLFNSSVNANSTTACSDARIKRIKGASDNQRDLAILEKIKVTDYEYIDTFSFNAAENKKVIAQQVLEVFPQAVFEMKVPRAVPNIFQSSGDFTINGDTIKVRLGKAVTGSKDLAVGSVCEFYLANNGETGLGDKKKGTIESIDGSTLTIRTKGILEKGIYSKVLVYGTEVSDFLSVDYDAISMLNVSATQELAKQLKAAQAEIAALKDEKEKNRGQNNKLQADVDKLKASVETLQQILQSKAEK